MVRSLLGMIVLTLPLTVGYVLAVNAIEPSGPVIFVSMTIVCVLGGLVGLLLEDRRRFPPDRRR